MLSQETITEAGYTCTAAASIRGCAEGHLIRFDTAGFGKLLTSHSAWAARAYAGSAIAMETASSTTWWTSNQASTQPSEGG